MHMFTYKCNTHTRTPTQLLSIILSLSPSNWNNSIYRHSSRPPWLRALCMEPPQPLHHTPPPPNRSPFSEQKTGENLPASSPNATNTKPISCQENTSRSAIFDHNLHPGGFLFLIDMGWMLLMLLFYNPCMALPCCLLGMAQCDFLMGWYLLSENTTLSEHNGCKEKKNAEQGLISFIQTAKQHYVLLLLK